MKRHIEYIPAPPKPLKRVGIYCRVSSSKPEQLKSLSNQISGLTRWAASIKTFKVVDIYVDIHSGKAGSNRPEIKRMIDDCKNKLLDVVLFRDISRLGRDTIETIESFRAIRNSGVRVIFEENNLDTQEDSSEFILSILESLYQADNESRSQNIKMGMQQRAMAGTSGFFNRKCYGYKKDEKGELIPHPEEAKVVRKIFEWYLEGESIIGILKLLEKYSILSPRGKAVWPKRTVDEMLSNEKYRGDSLLKHATPSGDHIMIEDNHQAIISREKFQEVQEEKARRSNLVRNGNEIKRAGKKYSSKK